MKRISRETQKRVVTIVLFGGMTRDQAAAKMGVPTNTISKWMDNHTKQVLLAMPSIHE